MRPIFPLAFLLLATALPPGLADPVCVQPKSQPFFVDVSVSGSCGGGSIVTLTMTSQDIQVIVCLENLDGSLPECTPYVIHCPNGQCWTVRRPGPENLLS